MRKSLVLLTVFALSACGEGEIAEISRAPSPVGGLDAVVGRMKAGENDPVLVVLTKPGANPGKGERILLADKLQAPPVVEWQDADHLTITCGDARVWAYRNFWTNGTATVAVALNCGTKGWRP